MYFSFAIAPCAVPLSTSSTVKSELYQYDVSAISYIARYILWVRFTVWSHRSTLPHSQVGPCTWAWI